MIREHRGILIEFKRQNLYLKKPHGLAHLEEDPYRGFVQGHSFVPLKFAIAILMHLRFPRCSKLGFK